MQRTLVLIKPDGIQRRLVGEIVARLERKGLLMCGMKMVLLDEAVLRVHYAHLIDKPFFAEIASFMEASPVVVTCWAGLDAVSTVRQICGVTKAREATPGTIRGDLAMSIQTNLVHASDSVEAAAAELSRFFKPGEIFEFPDHSEAFIYSSSERSSR